MTPAVSSDREPGPPSGGSVLAVALLLGVVGALLPALLASHYGALGIPRSDDWSYTLTLFRWVEQGRLGFNHWAATPVIGQLVVAAPVVAIFGRSLVAVHIQSAVVGWLGLLAVVAMGRSLVPRPWAVIVALTIAVGPLWVPMAATFMTDNWGFTATMVSLACGVEAFRRRPFALGWLVAGIAVGFVAVAIRQHALVAVGALLVVAAVEARRARDPKALRTVALLTVAVGIAGCALLAWWVGRPGVGDLTPHFPDVQLVKSALWTSCGYLRLVGLLLAPVVVLAGPVRIVRRAWTASRGVAVVLGGGTFAGLALQFALLPETPFVGNYVARAGVLGQDVLIAGPRPDVIPASAFDLFTWIAMASAALMVSSLVPALVALPGQVRAGRRWPESPLTALLALNVIGVAAILVATPLFDLRASDRHVMPVLAVIAFLVLRAVAPDTPGVPVPAPRPARRLVAPGIAVVLLALVGFAFAADSASFDATRWRVAEAATRHGFTPLQVDGGFEWVAWHRQTGPPYWPRVDPAVRAARQAAFNRPFCVRVGVGRDAPAAPVVAHAESSAPTRSSTPIVAFRLPGTCPGR